MTSGNIVYYPFSGSGFKGKPNTRHVEKLLFASELAHLSRRLVALDEILKSLASLPLESNCLDAFRYYSACSLVKKGYTQEASNIMIDLCNNASLRYRARSYMMLGTRAVRAQKLDEAFRLYKEGISIASRSPSFDPVQVFITKNLATCRGTQQRHEDAIDLLQSITPKYQMLKRTYPALYFDHLNSLAVEMAAVGRLDEARYYINSAVASPFSGVFPEWKETKSEIDLLGYKTPKSKVAFTNGINRKVIAFPVSGGKDWQES